MGDLSDVMVPLRVGPYGDGSEGDACPISAPDESSGARLDAVDVVSVLFGIGRIWLSSKPLLGEPGRELYTGSVASVSTLLSVGMPGSLSSLSDMKVGRVALRSSGGSAPVFLAAFSSAFFLCLS